MAMVDTQFATSSRMAYRAVSFVYDVITEIEQWNNIRKGVRALQELTDRELADVGLCRADIEFAARGRRR